MTTDENGVFDSSKATNIKFESGINLGVGGSERKSLDDGLQPDDYYLLEKETTDDAYYPSDDELKFPFTIDQETNHGAANKVTVKDNAKTDPGNVLLNTPFRAAVSLKKYDADAEPSEPIDNAEFELQYKSDGGGWVTSAQGLKTGKAYALTLDTNTYEAEVSTDQTELGSGVLQLTLNMKGEYRLIETANQGYEVPENDTDKYTVYFELENVDQQDSSEGAYDLTSAAVQTSDTGKGHLSVSTNAGNGKLEAAGIPNKRLTGSLSLTKTDTLSGDTIDGATFELQKEVSPDNWMPVVSGLMSGKSYKLNDANSDIDGKPTNAPSDGQLVVSNLLWGTYRFVETAPEDGYIGETDTGKVTSAELTIDWDTFNASNSGAESAALGNNPTQLKIKKVDGSGHVITTDDATFTIHGVFAGESEEETREFSTTNGVLTVPNATLIAGKTYTLSEKTAPDGYELAGEIKFTVDSGGVVSLAGASTDDPSVTGAGGSGSYVADKENGIWVITVSDVQISITLRKSGDKTSGVVTNPYEGAEFTISGDFAGNPDLDEGGTLVKTTNEQGALDLVGVLIAGKAYVLSETKAPKGYELIEGSLTFEVEPDGTIKTVGKVPEGYSVADGSVTINATDPSIEVTLVKYGANNERLSNATFTVTPKDGSAFANGDKDAITCTTQANGEVQLDSALLVAGNTYILEEVTAPDGYEVAGTVEFRVKDDGTVELGTPVGGTGSYRATEVNGTVIIYATDEKTDVTLIKVSTENSEPLSGAEFTLEPVSQGGSFANADLDGDGESDLVDGKLPLTSGANGEIALVGVLNGGQSYKLTETKAPGGYELADNPSFTFDVAKDGTITAAKGQHEADKGEEGFRVTSEGTEIELTAADEPIEAKIVKKDKNGTNLKGAEFTLCGTFAGDATPQLTVRDGDDGAEDGVISLPSAKLIAGNEYVIEEIVAPTGYEIAGEAILLVNSDGSITVKSQTNGSGEYVTNDEEGVAVITVKDEQTELGLEKVGTDGTEDLNATFIIKPATGSVFKTADKASIEVTPANAGEATRGELLEGNTYTIAETAPANGYQLTKDGFAFTVGADGTIQVASGEAEDAAGAAGFRIDANKIKIIATDAPITARVLKKNKKGETQPGAVFSIKPVEGSAFAKTDGLEEDGSLKLASTNGDGIAVIPSAMLIAGNSYTIAEVTAPQGYELAGSATFQVSDNGMDITLTDGATGGSGSYKASAEDGLLTLTATDEPVEIMLSKKDAAGDDLSGAEFSVVPAEGAAFAGGSRDAIFTTNGSELSGKLVAGQRYVLTETTAPAGYELIDGSLTFSVSEGGTIAPVTDDGVVNDEAFDIVDGGVVIRAVDEPIEITLNKVSSEDANAELKATFELKGRFASDVMDGGANDDVTTETYTTENGAAILTKLIAGETYELRELASENGYEVISGSLTFTVDKSGAIDYAVGTSHDPAFTIEDGGIAITAENTPVKITVEKQDLSGNKLDGAEFKLEGDFADGSDEKTVKSGDGISGLIVTNGSDRYVYTLTETKAPDGYELIDGGLTFTVDTNGAATVDGGPDAYEVAGNKVTLVAKDTPIEVKLRKIGEGIDDPLSGAVFEIFEGDEAEPLVTLDPTDEDGYAKIDPALLVQGKIYTIREKTAPDGYELAGSARFKVNEDGTLTFLKGGWLFFVPDEQAVVAGEGGSGEYGTDVDENGVALIVVSDSGIMAELNKTSENGASLAGATFRLADSADPEATEQILTVNEQGSMALPGLVANHTYTLTETKAPAGYELNHAVFTFTVDADGELHEAAGQESGDYSIGGKDVITITAVDKPIEAQVGKVDENGGALAGAEFTIAPAPGSQFASTNGLNSDGSLTVKVEDESGVAQIPGALLVADNAYDIQETKAPNGYELAGTARFKVTVDGTDIKLVSQPTDGSGSYAVSVDAKTGALTVTATDQAVQISLRKVDETGNELDGAEFTLAPATDKDAFARTDEDSIAGITPANAADKLSAELIAGNSYTLTETKVPTGYEEITGSFTFTVNPDGAIKPASDENDPAYALGEDGITIIATDARVEIGLIKLGANGAQVAGAHFSLAGADDPDTQLGEDIVSVADGVANIPNLEIGKTYVLTETQAPAGYEPINGSFTFKVEDDGTISIPKDAKNAAAYSHANKGSVTITATDTPVELQIEKRSEGEPGAPLTGATFQIAPAEGTGTTFADGKADPLSFSTTNGTTEVVSGQLVAGGTYVLTETAAPAGFERIAGSLTFTVENDGSVKPATGEGITNDKAFSIAEQDGLVTITATDKPIQVELTKTDLKGNALDGAEFTLTGIFAQGDGTTASADPETRAVAVKDGAATINGLVAGQGYTLTEVKAPAGCELAGSFSFTVTPDGTLLPAEGAQQAADGQAGYRIGADGLTLTAADAPIEAQLVKTDQAGNPLAGAVFEIAPADGSAFAGDYADKDALTLEATAADGTADISAGALIAGNGYTVTEVTAPTGFELAGTATFTANPDGTLTFADADADGAADVADGSGTYAASANGGTAVITATDALVELVVSKRGADGPLAGATLTLTEVADANGNTPEDPQSFEVVTDEAGAARFAGLKAGSTYELAEASAPAGYELLGQVARITVSADGTVEPAANTILPAAFAIGADGASMTVINQQVGVTLVKRDELGHGLADAEFTFAGAFPDGSTERSFTSDDHGVVFADLALIGSAEGTPYVLTETKAPAGYELLAPVTLLVFEDGTVTVDQDGTKAPLSAVTVDNNGATSTVAVQDTAIDLVFQKADAKGTALGGATFRITGAFADGSTEHEVVSAADGSLAVPQLVAGEKYVLRETAAPDGYQLIDGAFELTVTDWGTVEAESTAKQDMLFGAWSAGYVVSDDGLTITAVDVEAPSKPVEPQEPETPSEPTEPQEPTAPEEPTAPQEPVEPSQPTNEGPQPTKPVSTGDKLLPSTGLLPTTADDARLIAYVAAAGVLLVLAGLAHRFRTRFTRR